MWTDLTCSGGYVVSVVCLDQQAQIGQRGYESKKKKTKKKNNKYWGAKNGVLRIGTQKPLHSYFG